PGRGRHAPGRSVRRQPQPARDPAHAPDRLTERPCARRAGGVSPLLADQFSTGCSNRGVTPPARRVRARGSETMDKRQLIRRLRGTFLEELGEHVRTLNQHLLALEKGGGGPEQADRLKELFRAAHSLKGAARSVSAAVIEGACHRLEEILAAARDG